MSRSFADLVLPPDDIDFDHYMLETEVSHKVRPVSAWEDELNDEFSDTGAGANYPRLPWSRLANKVEIRPGEVSLWFGFNGHGKSLLVGQAIESLAAQGHRGCIASFEMRPRKTLSRMCRQFAGVHRPTPSEVSQFVTWSKGRLWIYDQTATVEPERVYAVIRYAVDKLKVNQFVVDNLTKCVKADDDYAGQKAVVDKLCTMAQALGIHIHLVHHARKDKDETRPPRKMDALGASAITNLVDNVFIVWRNKAKAESDDPDPNQPDALLIVDKQRHGTGWEGTQSLNYHAASQQYIEIGYHAIDLAEYPHRGIMERKV